MARKAFISSDMAHDERIFDLAETNPTAALMWPWIVTYLDDWGRGIASAKRIKSLMFPNISTITVEIVEKAIVDYGTVGLLEVYEDESHRYMAVPTDKWFKWQTHIRRDKREKDGSKYPPCSAGSAQVREDARNSANMHADDEHSAQFAVSYYPSPSPTPTPSPSLSPTPTKNSGGGEGMVSDLDVRIQRFYEQTFSQMLNDIQVSKLSWWCEQGMDEAVVLNAITVAREQGKDFGYVRGILKNQFERGIRTMAHVEEDNARRQVAPTSEKGAKRNGHGTNRTSTSDDAQWDELEERFFNRK